MLKSLGVPECMRVTKAVLTLEVAKIPTLELTALLPRDAGQSEIPTILKQYELVEKPPIEGEPMVGVREVTGPEDKLWRRYERVDYTQ
jgi:hypothetical protein